MRGPRCLVVAATVVLAVVLAPPALAKTDTVTRGNVTAGLSYEKAGFGFRDVRVRVVRDGVQLVSERGPGFRPCRGGACTSAHRGARDIDGDGSGELESADARFRGLFGCTACTPQPIRVLKLRDGRLVDVTRRFTGLIRRDLRGLIRLYRRARKDPLAARGVLAALTAERYLLGRGRVARRGVARALARGELMGVRGDGVADGRAYVRRLLRFLRRAGYRR